MEFIVAIDGPAGAGKGTVTSAVAKANNLLYLDTGAMYRCVTLKLLKEKIDFNDAESIQKILDKIDIDSKTDENTHTLRFFLDGEDVTKKIREKDVNENVSQVSHIPEVRASMVELQRKICENKDAILEGRDIGTNVFPHANVKIYLDASVDERVRRRVLQNREKGIDMPESEIRENIIKRDENDKNSKIAPLKQAEDAIYIDTTSMPINKVISKINKIVRKAKKDNRRIQNAYVFTKNTWWKRFRKGFTKGFLGGLYRISFRVEEINKDNFEKLDPDKGVVLCANHLNYLDAAGLILLNKRNMTFVAKNDLYRVGIFSYLGHLFDIIPVERNSSDMASVKLCLKALKEKKVLGIFPEGTRHGLDKHVKIKNGAAFLAYKAKVKVVPVGIKGSFKPFSKVTFNYGEPIEVEAFKSDDPEWVDKATSAIMQRIIDLSK